MFVRGTTGIKRIFAICATLLALLSAVCVISNFLINNTENVDNEVYTNKFVSMLETKQEFTLSTVFDFEFDKAYVSAEIYWDEKTFLKELNVATEVDIPILNYENLGRILFVKEDTIIYDYIYNVRDIYPMEVDIFVFPNTSVKPSEEGGSSFKPQESLGFCFEGSKEKGKRYLCDIDTIESIQLVKINDYIEEEDRYEYTILSQITNSAAFVDQLDNLKYSVNRGTPNRLNEGYVVIKISYFNGDYDLLHYNTQRFNRSGINHDGYLSGYFLFDEELFARLISDYLKEQTQGDGTQGDGSVVLTSLR